MNDDHALINHRLAVLEDDRREAAAWREKYGPLIAAGAAYAEKSVALSTQRMDELDRHISATDMRVEATSVVVEQMVASNRGTAAFWTSIAAAGTAAATAMAAFFHRGP